MFHLTSSLVGGLVAVTACALVAPPFNSAVKTGLAHADHENVNRTAKGDRLALPPDYRHPKRTVATVEVIGVHNAAIVYRDRSGHLLFRTDPLSNVTVISKGFLAPQLTLRDTPQSKPTPMVAPRHDRDATPAIPIGCEPVASPIVQPALGRIVGRCLS